MRLRKTSAVAAVLGAGATAVAGVLITAAPASALLPTTLNARSIVGLHSFDGVRLSATLTSNGVGVPGETIVFTSGGLGQCTGVTNASGVATCNAAAGGSTVIVNGGFNANFNGDGVYAPAYDRGTFIG